MRSIQAFTAAAAVLALAQPATARSDRDLVTSVDAAALKELMLSEGHIVTDETPFEMPSVEGKVPGGLTYNMIAADCPEGSRTGCESILMQVRYDEDASVTLEAVNTANYNEAAIGTWWDKEGKTLGFTRFVYLKGGVTWLNLRHNIRLLMDGQTNALNDFAPPSPAPANKN
ncbi:MAG: hypothetical protein ACREBO_01530 [Novosphingobium sp.]